MNQKKQLLLMISAIELGIKKNSKEKTRKAILDFLRKPEMRLGQKDGIFVFENGEPIKLSYFKSLETDKLIEDFMSGINDMKEYLKE